MPEHAFVIDLSGDDLEDQEDLEDARNTLRDELQEVPGVEISYITEAGEQGTRTDIVTVVGALFIAVESANLARRNTMIKTLASIIQNFVNRRGRAAEIRKTDGTTVLLKNHTAEELENVLKGIVEASPAVEPKKK